MQRTSLTACALPRRLSEPVRLPAVNCRHDFPLPLLPSLQGKDPLFHERLSQEQAIVEGYQPEASVAFIEVRGGGAQERHPVSRHPRAYRYLSMLWRATSRRPAWPSLKW